MAYKDITAGNKVGAKMLGARVIQTDKGTVGVEIAFSFLEPASQQQEKMNWVGWLSPAAQENTMRTLVDVLGFTGDDEVVPGTSEFKKTAFDYTRDVNLVVDMETYDNKTGPRIKWVNKPGSGGFKSMDTNVVKNKLNELGFKALFLSTKNQLGSPVPAPAPVPSGAFNSTEVPF